ncbi:MAG TPA: hypothetical protein VJ729_13390 [Nitrososphaeraceae archaeon]|jgi:hypothetical protein|nr:hypothetical protein [Nitrososphaeraceae archaeon]
MNDDASLEWPKLIQAKTIVKTSDHTACGNIVAEYRENIIIIEFEGTKLNEYMIPKSRVDHYDGRNLHLSISGRVLSAFCF